MPTMHTPETMRRYAKPIVDPSGRGLIRSTPELGWCRDHRTVRVVLEEGEHAHDLKDFLKRCADQFLNEEKKRDRAKYIPGTIRVSGPTPHFEATAPDVQHGDRGGTRTVARSLARDTAETGKVDYLLEADFWGPEYINEIPTDLAMDLFNRPGGRPGLMPLRAKDWRKVREGKW